MVTGAGVGVGVGLGDGPGDGGDVGGCAGGVEGGLIAGGAWIGDDEGGTRLEGVVEFPPQARRIKTIRTTSTVDAREIRHGKDRGIRHRLAVGGNTSHDSVPLEEFGSDSCNQRTGGLHCAATYARQGRNLCA